MELLSVPRIMISGVAAGVGKSLLAVGLAMELRKRGMSVSCAVLGLNLVDALVLKRICGRGVLSLDENLLDTSQVLISSYMAGVGADVVIILGQNGLFDGRPQGGYYIGSDSEMATLVKAPVILALDGRGMGTSVVAVVKGFSDLAKGFSVAGVISNRMMSDENALQMQKDLLSEAFASVPNLPPILGCVPEIHPRPELASRTRITQKKNYAILERQMLLNLGNTVANNLDIEELLKVAGRADFIRLEDFEYRPEGRKCRIAVADDGAFNLCFQDNIEYLKYFGAEIVTFSPLADTSLPNRVGGIYLTGAYLEEYAAELANNTGLLKAIKDFYLSGGVIYAEGAGAAYLCEEYRLMGRDESYRGVGIIAGKAAPSDGILRLQEAQTIEESILGRPGLRVNAVDTGEWKFLSNGGMRALRVTSGGSDPYLDGLSPGAQVLATLSFQHWGSNPEIAKSLVEAVSVVSLQGS